MKTRVSILLWVNKAAAKVLTPDTIVTIYCRLTVAGKRVELSTNLRTAYGNWIADGEHGRVKGKTPADKQVNTQLTKLRDQLTDIWADLERQGKPVTARRIAQVYHSGGAVLSMLELFTAFQQEREGLIGLEIARASFEATKSRYSILRDFLAAHRLTELRPEEFNHNMADKMLYWCLKERGHKRNYVNKVVQTMGQVLRWGVRREHLAKNPLALYQFKAVAAEGIKYLGVAELAALSSASLPVACLERVRDCFVFQCWTGLAYADLAALNVAASAEYHRDKAGNVLRVLRIRRAKSTLEKGYECVIPLLPEAERILALYADSLPVPSNQVYNRYLKQVGELCGIEADKMTSHVGRKTAGTLMLNRGVPLPVVSKFLGHANTIITQKLYAKLLDTTVVDAFAGFSGVTELGGGATPFQLVA